jgi:cytochrome P450 family 6
MFFVILLSVLLVIVAAYLRKTIYNDYWKQRNVVQLGEIMADFIFGDRSISEIYKEIYDKYPSEKYVGNYFGTRKCLILRDLRDAQAVLATDFESFHGRVIPVNDDDVLGNNLLTINDYNRWKLIRQKISPIFTSAKLKNMCNILEKCASDFVEMVKENKEMRDKSFNTLYTYTTASIGASVFGIDTNMKSSMDSSFLEMARKTVEPSLSSNIKLAVGLLSPSLFKLLNIKIFGDHEEFFVGAVKKVLNMRRNETKAIQDFIDMCLELQRNGTMKDLATGYELEPTDEIMAAQAFFFFLAGADTTATTMHFILLELASNPAILKRLHKEIDDVFTKFDRSFTYEVIDNMQYLDMVLNEAMRKYPPIGIIQRECTKNTVLPGGNLKVEQGITVTIPILAIHRDPKNYPNPDIFDPERFNSENVTNLPKFGYLPFGEGKRICLGKLCPFRIFFLHYAETCALFHMLILF